jgi:hypothetical protein
VNGFNNFNILLCKTLFEVARIFPPFSAGSFFQLVTIAPEFLIIGIKGNISYGFRFASITASTLPSASKQ